MSDKAKTGLILLAAVALPFALTLWVVFPD